MPIAVKCANPACGKGFKANDDWAGKSAKCPACKQPIKIPGGAVAAVQAPPPKPRVKVPPPPAQEASFDVVDEPAASFTPAPAKKKPDKKPAKSDAEDDGDDRDPTELWNGSSLLHQPRIMVKSQFITMGRAKFYVSNPDKKKELTTITETISTPAMMLRMLTVGPIRFRDWMATEVALADPESDEPLFYVRKPLQMFTLSIRVNILDDRRKLIGYFKTKIFSLLGGFWVYDANDEQLAEVKPKLDFKKPRVGFLTPDGDELGFITDELTDKPGFKVSVGTPGLIVTFGDATRNDPKMKVIMLATTLAMEMTGAGTKLFSR
jgi:hypothetical protein